MRPVAAPALASALAVALIPYPRESAHLERDATLSLLRLAFKTTAPREKDALLATGLNALVDANADTRKALRSFMVVIDAMNPTEDEGSWKLASAKRQAGSWLLGDG